MNVKATDVQSSLRLTFCINQSIPDDVHIMFGEQTSTPPS